MGIIPEDWGTYPKEYNREIHGPYNPSVYYGKRDTPLGDVKLCDLSAWFGRRNKSPRAMVQAFSRLWFKNRLTWWEVRQPGGAFLYQTIAMMVLTGFLLDYHHTYTSSRYRYH